MDVKEALCGWLADEGRVEGLRSIAAGWETMVWSFDLVRSDGESIPLVLRVYQGNQVADRAAAEWGVLVRLGRLGYPVPRVDRFEPDQARFGGPALVMERLQGRPMGDQFGPIPAADLVERLAGLMARLHRLPVGPFLGADGVWPDPSSAAWPYQPDGLRRIASLGGVVEPLQPVWDWIDRRAESVAFWPNSLLHGDLHFHNVLLDEAGSQAVIDWGITGLGDGRLDLAYLYVLLDSEGNRGLARDVKEAYERHAGRAIADWDYFLGWGLARRLVVMLVVLQAGSAAIGLRSGLEQHLVAQMPYVRHVQALVEQHLGVALPAVTALLDQHT